MDRKKELKEEYRQMKSDMGLVIIRSNFDKKYYIESSRNLNATINGSRFKLNAGNHLYQELQKEWNKHGESSFTIEVLERLEYDKDELKTDYKEDLKALQEIWIEKLTEEGLIMYQKR